MAVIITKRYDEILAFFDKHAHYMNDRVNTGIENNRKGWAFLRFFTSGPDPERPNILPFDGELTVKITQKSHEFKYGANLFMLGGLENEQKNTMYEENFSSAFNAATLPIYWQGLEPIDGKPRFDKNSEKIFRRPPLDLSVEFCEKHGIDARAHCLVFDISTPNWMMERSIKEIQKRYEQRFKELSDRYAHRIRGWEVTNETAYQENCAKTAFFKYPELIEWSFETAEKYFPENQLVINEALGMWTAFDHYHRDRSAYYMQIERALNNGARIDAVGLQYHMFVKQADELLRSADRYDPYMVYNTLDTYAKLGKPIQITEVTIPCYSDKSEDEEVQAMIVDKLYRMFFSHEAVEAISYWNLPDGYAAFAEPGDMTKGDNYLYSGLLRFDMTPKPAYNIIKNMFEKEFRTETICHAKNGCAEFKGFYGDYDLEITVGDKTYHKTIELSKNDSDEIRVVLDK